MSVFFIAEAGVNYEGSVDRAKEMVREATQGGADAIKFQMFDPDKLVTKDAPRFWEIKGCNSKTQYAEFKDTPQLSFDEYCEVSAYAHSLGIVAFTTPYDIEAVDSLERVGAPIYKIASFDITYTQLIKRIAKTEKPIILSTGASSYGEIDEAVSLIKGHNGNKGITILHCISNYPTLVENLNLKVIPALKKRFPDDTIGYSDHTVMPDSIAVISAAVALGAEVIEKHFTFDKTRQGFDHEISMDYDDLKEIAKTIRVVEQSLGNALIKPGGAESKAREFGRRSVVAECDIKRGEWITKDMVCLKRPGTGIEPKYLSKVISAYALLDIPKDTVLNWNMVKRGKQ